MLPLIVGIKKTKEQILIYSFLLFLLTTLPYFTGDLGAFYGISAILLNFGFLGLVFKLQFSQNPKDGLGVFFYSIAYLFLLFATMLIDKWTIL